MTKHSNLERDYKKRSFQYYFLFAALVVDIALVVVGLWIIALVLFALKGIAVLIMKYDLRDRTIIKGLLRALGRK